MKTADKKKIRQKPSYMKNQIAIQMWKKLTKLYEAYGRDLNEDDYLMIELLSEEYSSLREAQNDIKKDGQVYIANGYKKKNPSYDIAKDCKRSIIQLMAEMKLTAKSKNISIEDLNDDGDFLNNLSILMGEIK